MDPNQLLDLVRGLRCLPLFMKAHVLSVMQAKLDEDKTPDKATFREWLEWYYRERLAFVARYIEPLAADEAAGGHRFFAALCGELANATGPEPVAAALGLPAPDRFGYGTWFNWAVEKQLSRVDSLYCLASFWTCPDELSPEGEASALSLAGDALSLLGRDADALDILEVYLSIPESAYEDPAALRDALDRSPLAALDPSNRFIFVRSLANSLRLVAGREARHAARLLEAYLGIPESAYEDPAALRDALGRSPLAALDPVGQALFLTTLANALILVAGREARHAARLLEAYLGIPESAYEDPAALRDALGRSPLAALNSTGQANHLTSLANALPFVAGRESHAARLLEAWLDCPMPQFAAAPALRSLVPGIRLQVAQSWLEAAGSQHPDALDTCEAIIALIRTTQDEHLPSADHRRDFLTHVGGIRTTLQRIALRLAAAARQKGDEAEARRIERRLLAWMEELENRLLIERLLGQYGRHGGDGAALAIRWKPDAWQQRPWVVPADRFRDYLPPSDPYAWPVGALGPLETREATAEALAPPLPIPAVVRDEDAAKWAATVRREARLEQLVPQHVAWVRVLFGDDGTLHWWAFRGGGDELHLLAGGRSQPGARGRLKWATLAFDMTVERVWRAYASVGPAVSRAVLDVLRLLGDLAARDATALRRLAESGIKGEEFGAAVDHALGTLRARHRRLAVLGSVLRNHLGESGDEPFADYWLGVWRRALAELGRSWPEQGAERVKRLRRELDEATAEHLKAVQQELNLTPLWEATHGRIDWAQTDVLWQVQGPLLAAPLAWLDFGGQPLFRRVASTSSVVSLTLRRLHDEQTRAARPPAPVLLSAQWLAPADAERMRGLDYLHAGLERVAGGHGWAVRALGDDPAATRAHLAAALAGGAVRLAVVGGHGDEARAGVKLADKQPWCGDGADLDRLDWLILVACAVGRLEQEGGRDVEGLYAQLVANGGRCVLAARWPIADVEAATFITEVVWQYLKALPPDGPAPTFARARALNAARQALVGGHVDEAIRVTPHLAAAFEVYGLG